MLIFHAGLSQQGTLVLIGQGAMYDGSLFSKIYFIKQLFGAINV